MPQRNIKGLAGLAAQKLVDATKKNAKKFGEWATKKPSPTAFSNLVSPYNEPRTVKHRPKAGMEALPKAAAEVYIKPAAAAVKSLAQGIGKGAGRLAYGTIAPTPKSVKPNTRKKK